MDINQVLMDYDNMFGTHSLEDIEYFLASHIETAMDERDYASALSLMNEMMGFCRDTAQNDKGIRCCEEIEELLIKMGIEGTVEYASRLLNVANGYRFFGYYMKAQNLYERVEVIERQHLPAGDYRFAELYNDWGMLYENTGDLKKAEQAFRCALAVVDLQQNALLQQATTRCNLASVLLLEAGGMATGENGQRVDEASASQLFDEALKYLERALRIFEWDGKRDYHYSEALTAMGDALSMKEDYVQAAGYYEQAMQEIEKHVGQTDAYMQIKARYEEAERLAEQLKRHDSAFDSADNDKNVDYLVDVKEYDGIHAEESEKTESKKRWIDICQTFYETYGAKMIHEEFADYEARIAVGLVGEGSECFGYDDELSRDRDFTLGFCMWLSEEDYRMIGATLQQSYEQLLVDFEKEFLVKNEIELPENAVNRALPYRRGVSSVRAFYENLLGVKVSKTADGGYILPDSWMQIAEEKLAAATNGRVFRDDSGVFTKVRESLLEYYPTKVWMMRLAEKLHGFAQTAQNNYARMMARQDYVTANICVAKGMQYAMEIVYLLNQKYAPYYKWMRKGMQDLSLVESVGPILDQIARIPNQEEQIIACFEDIAEYLLMELKMQGVVKGTDTNMDVHAQDLVARVGRGDFGAVEDAEMEANYAEYINDLKQAAKEEMAAKEVDKIETDVKKGIAKEWGKEHGADREELIAEIVEAEWKQADNSGQDWNTFYIMRKSLYLTWPDELLASYLRDLNDSVKGTKQSEKQRLIAEELIQIQTDWAEKFAKKYPKMTATIATVYVKEGDNPTDCYAAYLRGEIRAYSEKTFVLYGKFITDVAQAGENLVYDIMNYTARLYGYVDVADAEQRL